MGRFGGNLFRRLDLVIEAAADMPASWYGGANCLYQRKTRFFMGSQRFEHLTLTQGFGRLCRRPWDEGPQAWGEWPILTGYDSCMEYAKPLTFEQHFAISWPPHEWRDVTVMIAVSGGPDSVALLRAMQVVKTEVGGPGRLIVAHFNHRLRPEADDDARFVAALAGQLNLPFEQGAAEVANLAAQRGDGVEAAARQARYHFFEHAAQRLGARYVATAHTADDQIETVLFNILRGTGLAGLAGMPRARPLGPAVSAIRPLLNLLRDEVLKYLDELGQRYRVDSSNACHDFTRNRLRHELLPLLREKYNPDIDGALQRLSQLAGDAQRVIERLAGELLDRCWMSTAEHEIRLSVGPLAGVEQHLRREVFVVMWQRMDWPLQNMGFADWNTLARMAQGPEADHYDSARRNYDSERSNTVAQKRCFPGNIVAERRGDELILSR